MTPLERYQQDLQDPEFLEDPAQRRAVEALQALYDALLVAPAEAGLMQRLKRRFGKADPQTPVTGLYFWGGVGRGKTYLVDTFFDCLPFAEKRRLHFHRFMHKVHDELKTLRDTQNPLQIIGRRWAEQTRVLCFDEFFVSDITDAMILAGLLEALFDHGVTLVATSNIEPSGLYKDGLQRDRFVPAIRLIEKHTRIMNVDGGVDYRLRMLERAEIYHVGVDAEADVLMAREFSDLSPEPGRVDTPIEVEGRRIATRRVGDGVVWFDFEAVCDGPRSQNDYIELACEFQAVLVSGVPCFGGDNDDQARRFISMVDEFYDRQVKLILTAEAPLEALYRGKRLAFEFERTVSRLQEMQSHEYLARPHRP